MPRGASVEVEAVAVFGEVSNSIIIVDIYKKKSTVNRNVVFVTKRSWTIMISPPPVGQTSPKKQNNDIDISVLLYISQAGNNNEIRGYGAVLVVTIAIFGAIMLRGCSC